VADAAAGSRRMILISKPKADPCGGRGTRSAASPPGEGGPLPFGEQTQLLPRMNVHRSGNEGPRVKRARFLKVLGAGLAGVSLSRAAAAPGRPDMVIGVLSDCQYADIDTPPKSKRLYRQSPAKLTAAIDHLNNMGDVDMMLHLGDAVDRDVKSYGVVMPIFARAACPFYHVAGNHDYDIAEAEKARVPELLGMKSLYYSVERGGWRLIMLDGNALSLFSAPRNSARWQEADAFRKKSVRKLAEYNGGLGTAQRHWLVKELAATRAAGQRAILCCHYPVLPVEGHILWDAEAVHDIVQQHRNVIAAWWNGHNHDGNYAARWGIHFLNFRGMVDTPQNSYARVALYADRMEVTGYGREPHRTLRFPAQDFPRTGPARRTPGP
jgi:predicted phosphodiesterase